MTDGPTVSRSLLRRAENTELSLGSLEAISEIRECLGELEKLAMISARDKGATVEDIAAALRLTPQAIYYRFRHERANPKTPGAPKLPEPALGPEAALAASAPTPVNDSVLTPEPTLGD
jgi:hypothetical protein